MAILLTFNLTTNEWQTPSPAATIDQDIEITDTAKGIILKAPDGDRWRVTIDNDGNLITTNIDL